MLAFVPCVTLNKNIIFTSFLRFILFTFILPSANAGFIFYDGLPVEKFLNYSGQFGPKTQKWPIITHEEAEQTGQLKDSTDYHEKIADALKKHQTHKDAKDQYKSFEDFLERQVHKFKHQKQSKMMMNGKLKNKNNKTNGKPDAEKSKNKPATTFTPDARISNDSDIDMEANDWLIIKKIIFSHVGEAAVEKGPEKGGVTVEWYNWFKTNLPIWKHKIGNLTLERYREIESDFTSNQRYVWHEYFFWDHILHCMEQKLVSFKRCQSIWRRQEMRRQYFWKELILFVLLGIIFASGIHRLQSHFSANSAARKRDKERERQRVVGYRYDSDDSVFEPFDYDDYTSNTDGVGSNFFTAGGGLKGYIVNPEAERSNALKGKLQKFLKTFCDPNVILLVNLYCF